MLHVSWCSVVSKAQTKYAVHVWEIASRGVNPHTVGCAAPHLLQSQSLSVEEAPPSLSNHPLSSYFCRNRSSTYPPKVGGRGGDLPFPGSKLADPLNSPWEIV